jgi:S1-C subfamily serine protease
MTSGKIGLMCLLSAILGGLLAVAITEVPETAPISVAQEPSGLTSSLAPVSRRDGRGDVGASSPVTLTPEERVNISVYESANRSAVNISTKSGRGDGFFWIEVPSAGVGSGTVIDREGHVLTNSHVVDGAREVIVTLFDGKSYEARLVGMDRTNDMAVLKIDAPADTLYPVEFGDSSRLLVGQRVYAIGNPFGLQRTLSTGIISSLDRDIPSRTENRYIKQVIQIDAAINPGNSGGPLLDTGGRMIGMNTAIASHTGESAGVGFAIPVNTIARIVPQLIRDGRVLRPVIGIAKVYPTDEGLQIAALVRGGPAERAGLKGFQLIRRQRREGLLVWEQTFIDRSAADLIIGVDGQKTRSVDDLLTIIEGKQPGDEVGLGIVRQGERLRVGVTLEADE